MSRDSWSEAEDQRLVAGRALGMSWEQISRDYLPGRTPDAMRTRFRIVEAGGSKSSGNRETWSGFNRNTAAEGSYRLHARTLDMFIREARRERISLEAAALRILHPNIHVETHKAFAEMRA